MTLNHRQCLGCECLNDRCRCPCSLGSRTLWRPPRGPLPCRTCILCQTQRRKALIACPVASLNETMQSRYRYEAVAEWWIWKGIYSLMRLDRSDEKGKEDSVNERT